MFRERAPNYRPRFLVRDLCLSSISQLAATTHEMMPPKMPRVSGTGV
jgi:hypothetical protein